MIRTGIFLVATLAAAATAAQAQQYRVGEHVEAYSPMAGRWVAGRIVALDGNRFMFKADDRSLANDYWGTTADQLRRPAPAPAPAPAMTQRRPPVAMGTAQPARPAVAPAGSCAGGGGGNVRIAGAVPAPLGKGMWRNGERLGTPGQTNYKYDAQGRKNIVAVAPPGMGSFLGRYSLMVGGTWSTSSIRDLGGGVQERTLNWNVPAKANVLAINADGTWYRKDGSHIYHGRWIDLGQNVAQLIGYDGDDWTGSVQRSPNGICRMEMRSPLGQTEWGQRL
jgi:hypothetical protein